MKLIIPFVETMAIQSCNLSCVGCTNYSDLIHKGYVSWNSIENDLKEWLEVIDIEDFGIMGGEPLLNPEIEQWIIGIRKLLPNSRIRFTTNGLKLHKNFHLVDLMHKLGNFSFKITAHKNTTELQKTIEKILKSYDWKPVAEFGIDRLITTNDFRFHVKSPSTFYKTFKGSYHDMKPHNSNPIEAFDMCIQQTCPLLHNKGIYKCSTSGLLEDVLKRRGKDYSEWRPYIPDAIYPTSTHKQIKKFIDNFGKPNKICGQCPTKNDKESIIDHYANVSNVKVAI